MSQLVQWAANDWLNLRRNADSAARDAAMPLLARYEEYFASRPVSPDTALLGAKSENKDESAAGDASNAVVAIYDLGAGSGANLAWLGPRVRLQQAWTLIDRDAELLQLAPIVAVAPQVIRVDTRVQSIDDLSLPELGAAGLVTASAVLDVLSSKQIERLAALLALARVAALFSLNVTGSVHLTPKH